LGRILNQILVWLCYDYMDNPIQLANHGHFPADHQILLSTHPSGACASTAPGEPVASWIAQLIDVDLCSSWLGEDNTAQ
jgi:hypothetical protein